MSDHSKPAFPYPAAFERGLTFREYAAVAAMQALLTSNPSYGYDRVEIASRAVKQADAVLAKLKETTP